MNKYVERISNGIFKENPTFVLMLGYVSDTGSYDFCCQRSGHGAFHNSRSCLSNLIISALRKIIPDRVRIPAFIVIVASLVTIVQLLMQGYAFPLFITGYLHPLIVVNCIILGRAESYASKNDAVSSLFDGIGMGLGFSIALTLIGIFREFLGGGAFFGKQIIPEDFHISNLYPCSGCILRAGDS